MKSRHLFLALILLWLPVHLLATSWVASAQQPQAFVPNKALCEKMLRFGKEAYMRGRYLDAKEYFRKAIQADPYSQTAWRYYDQTVIFGLAERVEKDAALLAPGKSVRSEQPGTQTTAPGSPAEIPQTSKEPEFKIVEDEGC
ncbi:MAG: hypothetical protein DRH15_05990 [Deltaproteobacteria bacterium]|nr:MAG: hypothetical protein DRH15_05990 [Deltaproteobacteria bacterium]